MDCVRCGKVITDKIFTINGNGIFHHKCFVEWRNRETIDAYLGKKTMEQIRTDWEEVNDDGGVHEENNYILKLENYILKARITHATDYLKHFGHHIHFLKNLRFSLQSSEFRLTKEQKLRFNLQNPHD